MYHEMQCCPERSENAGAFDNSDAPPPPAPPAGDQADHETGDQADHETGDRRRPVHVSITRFTGLGRHVHVEMREEPDADGNGVLRVMSFVDHEKAQRWVRHVFHSEFSNRTHRLLISERRTRRWFYPEGD